jgi:A/G-specific adenine glycosylase
VSWYQEARRELPWRINRDPYRILVSELMLVQTTVAAAIPYFERFLHRFPDLASLAAADESEVLKAWEGLGYYRRAKQLHAAARQIVREHSGKIPDNPEAVRGLPGVGPYIAGAILSFAFDRTVPIVEANSQRVLARLFALEGNLAASSTRKLLWASAERLVPAQSAGTFNQALIELGALVCTPRVPRCLICPLSALCEARRQGIQDRLPVISPKATPRAVTEACAIILQEGRLLIVRRGTGCLWEGFWEFPTIHVDGADPAGRSFGAAVDLGDGIARLTGIRARIGAPVMTLRYSVTNHRVKLIVHLGEALGGKLEPGAGFVGASWVEPRELRQRTFSSAGRRLISWIEQNLNQT